jgi:signal transduction histidine kinase
MEVVQNLVDNAVRFMGDQPAPHIQIGVRPDGQTGQSVFFVQDNGIGIASQYHENIFGLFNRLNPNTAGTGIGLALVKRIIETHGGQIWVESAVGEGATFCFTLGL